MKCPNVFVDTSYVIYYVGHSTYAWYKKEFSPDIPEDGSFDPMADIEFKKEFDHRFKSKLFYVIGKNTSLLDRKHVYFCLDCKRDKIWRMSYLPEYKVSRKTAKKEFSWKGIFGYALDVLLPNLSETLGCKLIKVDCAEGDDIIGVCVKNSDRDNLIIASDNDLVQLADDKTKIFNLLNEEITTESATKKYNLKEALSKSELLKLKIIVGDGGDEIPGIIPRVGPKTAFKMIKDPVFFKEKIQSHPEAIKNFKRNALLTDLTNIPKEISTEIMEKFNNG